MFSDADLSARHSWEVDKFGDVDATQLKTNNIVKILLDLDRIAKAGSRIRVVPEVGAHECRHAQDALLTPEHFFSSDRFQIQQGEWDAYTTSAKVRSQLGQPVDQVWKSSISPVNIPPGLK